MGRYLPGCLPAKPSMVGLPTTLRPPVYKQVSPVGTSEIVTIFATVICAKIY